MPASRAIGRLMLAWAPLTSSDPGARAIIPVLSTIWCAVHSASFAWPRLLLARRCRISLETCAHHCRPLISGWRISFAAEGLVACSSTPTSPRSNSCTDPQGGTRASRIHPGPGDRGDHGRRSRRGGDRRPNEIVLFLNDSLKARSSGGRSVDGRSASLLVTGSVAAQQPNLTKPSPSPPPVLPTWCQDLPTRLLYSQLPGSLLDGRRFPPIHYVICPKKPPPEGHDWDAKRGHIGSGIDL